MVQQTYYQSRGRGIVNERGKEKNLILLKDIFICCFFFNTKKQNYFFPNDNSFVRLFALSWKKMPFCCDCTTYNYGAFTKKKKWMQVASWKIWYDVGHKNFSQPQCFLWCRIFCREVFLLHFASRREKRAVVGEGWGLRQQSIVIIHELKSAVIKTTLKNKAWINI